MEIDFRKSLGTVRVAPGILKVELNLILEGVEVRLMRDLCKGVVLYECSVGEC